MILVNQKILISNLQLMGNQTNCFSIKPQKEQQTICQIQICSQVDISAQEWENQDNRLTKFQKECNTQVNSLNLQKLNQINIPINKLDTIFLQEDDHQLNKPGLQAQTCSVHLFNGNAHTNLKDYISFKKYSPKINYKFMKMMFSSKTSKIYQVICINNNLQRAVKVLKPKQIINCSYFNKFSNIMAVLNQLDHPNIIRFYEFYDYKSKQFLVMQYMEGGSLRDIASCRRFHKVNGYVTNTDLYFQEVKMITKQMLYVLRYLHQSSIAHLNIKPKNIMLINKFGSKKQVYAKLVGFGSSMINVTNSLRPVDNDFIKNKFSDNDPIPLQIQKYKSICLKTDIWMLGIAIFQTVTKTKINKNNIQQQKDDPLQKYLRAVWKKLQQQLQFSQTHFIDLIIKMVKSDYNERLSAFQCLEHLWFVNLQFDELNTNLKQSSKNAFQMTANQKKSNNLISYIQNLIVYKNITQAEMTTISGIFSILDKDKNGSVAIQQLIEYLQQECKMKNETGPLSLCLQILSNVDNNGSGSIDYHQFSKALVDKRKHITRQTIQEIFNHIDQDGNGQIVLSELKLSLNLCNFDQLQYYMKKIDKNLDSTITKTQFINYCIQKFQEKWNRQNQKILNKE